MKLLNNILSILIYILICYIGLLFFNSQNAINEFVGFILIFTAVFLILGRVIRCIEESKTRKKAKKTLK